jgi:hypothetical protein
MGGHQVSSTGTGLPDQHATQTTFRVVGCLLLVIALALLATGLVDFLSAVDSDSSDGPHKFWMLFVGVLLLAPAGWCLQAGFMGAASRYVAGETMPVVKDSASYLTDGKGVLGVGQTDEGRLQGPFCSRCGTRNDAGASYCDHCGAALAG